MKITVMFCIPHRAVRKIHKWLYKNLKSTTVVQVSHAITVIELSFSLVACCLPECSHYFFSFLFLPAQTFLPSTHHGVLAHWAASLKSGGSLCLCFNPPSTVPHRDTASHSMDTFALKPAGLFSAETDSNQQILPLWGPDFHGFL